MAEVNCYLLVKLVVSLPDDLDQEGIENALDEVVNEMDYSFDHLQILDTDIQDYSARCLSG